MSDSGRVLDGSSIPPPKPPANGFGSDCPGSWKPPGEGAPLGSLPGSLNEGGPPAGGLGGSADAPGKEKGELAGGESDAPPEPGNWNPELAAGADGAGGLESGSLNPEDGGSTPPEPGN